MVLLLVVGKAVAATEAAVMGEEVMVRLSAILVRGPGGWSTSVSTLDELARVLAEQQVGLVLLALWRMGHSSSIKKGCNLLGADVG